MDTTSMQRLTSSTDERVYSKELTNRIALLVECRATSRHHHPPPQKRSLASSALSLCLQCISRTDSMPCQRIKPDTAFQLRRGCELSSACGNLEASYDCVRMPGDSLLMLNQTTGFITVAFSRLKQSWLRSDQRRWCWISLDPEACREAFPSSSPPSSSPPPFLTSSCKPQDLFSRPRVI